jgi:hypothetical protein
LGDVGGGAGVVPVAPLPALGGVVSDVLPSLHGGTAPGPTTTRQLP